MMVKVLDWECLIRDALKVSRPEGPKNLFAVLSGRQNPFLSGDEKQRQDLSQAHQSDLGAIYSYRHSGQPLTEDDRTVWLDRLAWLLNELEACKQQRPNLAKLAAILSVSRALSFDTPIWERIPASIFSDNLFASMAGLVGATHCNFSTRAQREPIWEREVIDEFLQADNDGDWPTIETKWQTIASVVCPDQDLVEAIACLCSAGNGMQALAFAIDQFNSILPIMNVASTLSPHQIGKVAPLLKSDRGRFVLVQSLAFNHPRSEALSRDTLEGLATLFQDVQRDVAEWQKWMKALNRFPVRSKALQSAFGESLVNSTIEVKLAYIEAINLSCSYGECREAVTDCFATFARIADLEERKKLWRLAQRRWANWNFNERKPEDRLTWMAVSELDYGVIRYAVENLKTREREDALKKIVEEMNGVANTWHRDVTEHHSTWYRALSKWQIFQYAQQIIEGNANWELPTRVYYPFDPDKDRYFAMTYPMDTQYRWRR